MLAQREWRETKAREVTPLAEAVGGLRDNMAEILPREVRRDQLCERVEHVAPLGRAEKSRADPTVTPDRVTGAFHCDVTARNHSNVPMEVSRYDVTARNHSNMPMEVSLQIYSVCKNICKWRR
ncbi:hypothetical protein EVAR_3640_1 [Eumeta japonica]|uniref:Uncharacterized protein n=1 Tax=Eumeta variegata TaxID=151549 RepID=A0A4C1SYH6_EUMVA|nr:hypothetical protein EVAR_3640_1 [Eumeta japonica]